MTTDDLDLEPLPPEIRADNPLDAQAMSKEFQEFIYKRSNRIRSARRYTLHEAGHCIGAWHYEHHIDRMDIRRSTTGECGQLVCMATFTIPAGRFSADWEATHFQLAVVSVSGLVAERLVFREDIDIFNEFTWSTDIREAKFHLESSNRFKKKKKATLAKVLKESETIVRENWASVERLTMGALNRRRVLSGSQILKLIEGEG